MLMGKNEGIRRQVGGGSKHATSRANDKQERDIKWRTGQADGSDHGSNSSPKQSASDTNKRNIPR